MTQRKKIASTRPDPTRGLDRVRVKNRVTLPNAGF